MSEPRYAALLFSEICTLCGASTKLKPDPYLFARLCASCRDTHLVDYDEAVQGWNTAGSVRWSQFGPSYPGSCGTMFESHTFKPKGFRQFCLLQDVERTLRKRTDPSNPNSSSDTILASNWSVDSYNLAQCLLGLEQAHYQELEAIRKQRRQL
ncbi:hypothetical protein FRC12_006518 [Ceratobasidium sp. 428]|nr:hypothetical protein FRC12_006518 [Ceratobasidium sp. 428]